MNFISRFWLNRRQNAVRRILKRSKVLDVGCGEYKIMPQALGIDVQLRPGVDKTSDARKLPFPKNSFDAVTMLEVIEHVENPEKALREIKRVLRPGGQVIISTPNVTFAWKSIWHVWSHIFGRKWLGTHVNEFTEEKISKLFSKYFKLKSTQSVNNWIIILEGEKAD